MTGTGVQPPRAVTSMPLCHGLSGGVSHFKGLFCHEAPGPQRCVPSSRLLDMAGWGRLEGLGLGHLRPRAAGGLPVFLTGPAPRESPRPPRTRPPAPLTPFSPFSCVKLGRVRKNSDWPARSRGQPISSLLPGCGLRDAVVGPAEPTCPLVRWRRAVPASCSAGTQAVGGRVGGHGRLPGRYPGGRQADTCLPSRPPRPHPSSRHGHRCPGLSRASRSPQEALPALDSAESPDSAVSSRGETV